MGKNRLSPGDALGTGTARSHNVAASGSTVEEVANSTAESRVGCHALLPKSKTHGHDGKPGRTHHRR